MYTRNSSRAARTIQSWWHRSRRPRARAAGIVQSWWRRCASFPYRDPITLGMLRLPVVWLQGQFFGADALREAIQYSGDIRNPLTRVDIPTDVLVRLGVGELGQARAAREQVRSQEDLAMYFERELMQHARALVDTVAGPTEPNVERRFQAMTAAVLDLLHVGGRDAVDAALEAAIALLMSQDLPIERIAVYMVVRGFFADLRV